MKTKCDRCLAKSDNLLLLEWAGYKADKERGVRAGQREYCQACFDGFMVQSGGIITRVTNLDTGEVKSVGKMGNA